VTTRTDRRRPSAAPALPARALPAVLALAVLALAACLPVGTTLAIFTKQTTVTANTVGTAASFPVCYPDAVLADNPVSYWRLNETSGTAAADSKGTNPGTYIGGPTLGQTGALPDTLNNKAATFDGINDRVEVNDSASLRPAQLTVEAWVKPGAGLADYDSPAMKTSNSSWTDGYGLYYMTAGTINFFVNNWSSVVVTAPIAVGEWTHVVGTFDGSTLRLYKNGAEAASLAYSTPIAHATTPLHIGVGQDNGAPGWYWPGDIDDVAVYSSALTATKVRTHYNTGRCYKDAVLADNPAGYWRLGETAGTTAADGMRGRHGTYTGGPTLNQTGALNLDTNPAATFDGVNDYVTVPYTSALNPATFTLEAWAKPTGGAGTWRTVAESYKAPGDWGYGIWASNVNNWQAWITNGAGGSTVLSAPLTLNSWAHLVETYDGTTLRFYVNGLLTGSATGSYAVNPSVPLGIGGGAYDGATWQQFFPGSIDEVALYATALSQSRIRAHYLIGRSYKDTVLDSSPVSYWRLGEAAGTSAADSKGTNTGTYTNSPTLGQAGPLAGDSDTAVQFDGSNDEMQGPNVFGYAGTASFSVEFWLNPSTAAQNAWRPIVSKMSGVPANREGWAVWLGPANDPTYSNKIAFDRWNGTTQHFLSGSVTVPVGSWYHVVATYDGATMTIYVNGAVDSSRGSALSLNSHAQPLRLASVSVGPDHYGGRLDDVAVYSWALSGTEVQLHYDSGRQ
jgi:hypothetical protein